MLLQVCSIDRTGLLNGDYLDDLNHSKSLLPPSWLLQFGSVELDVFCRNELKRNRISLIST